MTRVADDVLGKVSRQQWDVYNRICTGGLSTDRFFRVIRQLLCNLSVVIVHREWAKAVEAGNYESSFSCINPEFTVEDLPPLNEAEVGVEVSLRQNYETTTTQMWLDSLDNDPASKDKFAHPLKVLAIGYDGATKDEQRDGAIFTIWFSPRTGLLWHLFLGGGAGQRRLGVDSGGPRGMWFPPSRAAVVSK